jgi:hypothetical protein
VALLAALVSVVVATPAAVVATALVAVSVVARWGTGDLAALTGAQAVLGPAVMVGPAPAALSAGLAALAITLLGPAGRARELSAFVLSAAAGATAGLLVYGPGDLPVVRALSAIVGTAVVVGLGHLPRAHWRAMLAVVVAVAAASLAAL